MPTVPLAPLAALPGRPCPMAASLEVVGERWALLVVREVALGQHRFSGIVAGTGAPRDRVTARLRSLVAAGVLERRQYQSGPDRFDYHLTDAGRDLLPVLDALVGWGRVHAVHPDDPDLPRHRRRRWVDPATPQESP
ncbi:DNA-binding transcriptional regulator, HxlR family [Nocardioides scoriae]|uniref:DNA-binding transcriptional regulator, HxlR family n=1 Tax=Nocardioides scoriae TaxID=642780 RepID=A0A1H1UNP1_9ACTN|nr:helix-turn-helix domain-containing protein [Nocardioides scoriae]SDS73459.1 DNA-binding transcriptional regulator, HxlR family [Nocardioides scoriae]